MSRDLEIIEKLENIIGIKLNQLSDSKGRFHSGYIINENNNIIELCLCELGLSNFPRIILQFENIILRIEEEVTKEEKRLKEDRDRKAYWRRWGPYLSERQWGTVREDYSYYGTAWEYFSHEDSRSRAYRWGEDGIAGISDNHQRLCFAISLWNGRDSIIKERLFGLTGNQGNHGEDVKEYYFYLDNTPTHSYMKYLYKYPQRAFPYRELVERNKARTGKDPEYELLDTGIFDDDRYFDVQVEYAKAAPDDICIRIRARIPTHLFVPVAIHGFIVAPECE